MDDTAQLCGIGFVNVINDDAVQQFVYEVHNG